MAKHESITPEGHCPVAHLAAEMAKRIRGMARFEPGVNPDGNAPGTDLSAEYIRRVLFQQLGALQEAVPMLEARSVKGALLQIYVCAYDAYAIDACLPPEGIKPEQAHDVRKLETRIWRGMRSAAAFLEAEHDDDDLRTIREHLTDTEVMVDRVLAEAMQ